MGKRGGMLGQAVPSAADDIKNGRCTLNEMGSEHLPLLKPDGYEAITVQLDSSSFPALGIGSPSSSRQKIRGYLI